MDITVKLTMAEIEWIRAAIDTHLTHQDSVCGWELSEGELEALASADVKLAGAECGFPADNVHMCDACHARFPSEAAVAAHWPRCTVR